jgi:hypothetical protein
VLVASPEPPAMQLFKSLRPSVTVSDTEPKLEQHAPQT